MGSRVCRHGHRGSIGAAKAELDPGAVDRPADDAVERLDLAHQMALAEPSDRRLHDISPIAARFVNLVARVTRPEQAPSAATGNRGLRTDW